MTVRFDSVPTDGRAPAAPLGDEMGSPFELRAGSYEASALTVLSLRGREQISRPFSFELTVAASADVDDATIESDLLDHRACLMMRAGASHPHRETDLELVERLLAEEGIFYTFDHGGPDADAEVVSFGDSANVYPQIEEDAELVYRPHGGAGKSLSEHHLERFDRRRSLRPTSVLRWGYDFQNPAQTLTAEAKLEDLTRGEPARGEAFVHHEEDEEPNVLPGTVTAELAQLRARVEVGRGASGCRRLVPGLPIACASTQMNRIR